MCKIVHVVFSLFPLLIALNLYVGFLRNCSGDKINTFSLFISGNPGWGIAWYVNGYIIPKLQLKRNVTYTFTVNGGKDANVQANYHPFYITNDADGGYFQLTDAEKEVSFLCLQNVGC